MNKTTTSFLEKVPEEKNSANDDISAAGREANRSLAGSKLSMLSKRSPSKLTARNGGGGGSSQLDSVLGDTNRDVLLKAVI